MKKIFLLCCMCFFLAGPGWAGMLTGRIIGEDGKPLSKARITIQGNEVMTNEFGGYEVKLPDGESELNVDIHGKTFRTPKITIYSPQIKQNWRIDPAQNLLRKAP